MATGGVRTASVVAVAMTLALAAVPTAVPAEGEQEEGRPAFSRQELKPLVTALQTEGFSRETLRDIFYDGRLRKVERVISLNAVNGDSARNYEQFLTPYAIGRAKRFKRRYYGTLVSARQQYEVPEDIIVAILLVETQFGTYPRRYRVLEVFTTLFVEGYPGSVERHYDRLKHEHPDLEREYLQRRLVSKAQWAYEQLVALVRMAQDGVPEPYRLKGSYAGAFGIAQFLPSSYVDFAVDGNRDDRVNLEHIRDAIASTANYLHNHGWTREAPLEQKRRAVWEYNHSPHYVDAIFAIARKMAVPPPKSRFR